METRDGVRLDAHIYQPDAPGRFPVLLMRQPYGRRIASTICYAHPTWYAARGYIVVLQDVRGRGTSAGRFRLFADDIDDGADSIAWAAGLPASNGTVGMYGFSYQGSNQLLAAAGGDPALKAVAPAMIGWDLRTDWAYENDAFCLAAGLGWATQIAAENARLAGDEAAFQELFAASRAMPLHEAVPARPAFMERNRGYTHYFDWIDHPDDCDYWRAISPSASAAYLEASGPPMLFIGGWYDPHLSGTLAAYRRVASAGIVPAKLIVGPWAHFPWGQKLGAVDFGPEAITPVDALQVRWFDRWLKNIDNGVEHDSVVTLFDMGSREWRQFDHWPSHQDHLFLGGGGHAALDIREGCLTPQLGAGGADRIVHDPWRPVPTIGGTFGSPPGPIDRGAIDARPDVLTFTTAPLIEDLTLAGSVGVTLFVDSDAASFDIACTLSRVTPSGQALPLTDGYRHLTKGPEGGSIEIPMRATCITLANGERLRLSVAGASFPAYPVNPGMGQNPTQARQIDAQIVTIAIAYGAPCPSVLMIPVLP
ncbi:MAG: family X-Pro dipeptidyl-peptidase [Rhodospirillales bacterium]|nr:family X-Pro dipeptidyl-peptidase [Rhodospirillales bacterium]